MLLVAQELGENLATISTGSSLSEQIHRLVQWAESRGKLSTLLEAVAQERRDNPRIKRFQASLPRVSTTTE